MLVVVFTPSRLRIDHGVLKVFDRDGGLVGEVSVSDIDLLVIVGRGVGLSSGLLLVLSRVDIPVVVHGRDSDVFLYRVFSVMIPSIRVNQYRVSRSPELSLLFGREFIRGKLYGLRNLLKYLMSKKIVGECDDYIECIEEKAKLIDNAESIEKLMNIEASGSKCFWACLHNVFSDLGFPGRIPRNPDPVNRALDYSYAVLYGFIYHGLIAAGLDPYAGFIHSVRSGKASLVYDFSEQYKPFIIHLVVSGMKRVKNPSISDEGYLDPRTISYLSKMINSWINKRRREIGMSIRRNIYLKSKELADALRSGYIYSSFIYKPW